MDRDWLDKNGLVFVVVVVVVYIRKWLVLVFYTMSVVKFGCCCSSLGVGYSFSVILDLLKFVGFDASCSTRHYRLFDIPVALSVWHMYVWLERILNACCDLSQGGYRYVIRFMLMGSVHVDGQCILHITFNLKGYLYIKKIQDY
jgi:hypothetical protein